MYRILPILFLLTSCRYGAGLAVHPISYNGKPIDDRSDNKPNPLGVIRMEQNVDNMQFYYEHISSIPRTNEDAGLNMIGVNYMFGER